MWMSNTSSFKNKLINGNFDIWQRGVTTSTISHQYLADRWDSYAGGTLVARVYSKSVFTLGQTAVPGEPSNYATINITNGGDATNGNVQILQHIENVRTLSGKKVTLSFWAKATSALKIGVAYTQGFGSSGSPSVDVSASTGVVTLSTTWTKYVQTFTLPSISGKTIGTDGEQTSFTKIQFFMSAGTALVAVAPTVGIQTGTFDIAQVQLELGDTATDFENRPIGVELAMCQRYGEAIYLRNGGEGVGGQAMSSSTAIFAYPFKVTKRINVPGGSTSLLSGTVGVTSAAGTGTGTSTLSFSTSSLNNAIFTISGANSLVAGNATHLYATSDAVIFANADF